MRAPRAPRPRAQLVAPLAITPTPPLLLMRASSAIVLAAVLVTATTAASRVGTDVCYVREGGRWVGNPRGKPYGCGPPPADAPAADAAENVGSSDERATGLPAEWFARLWCGFPFVHGGALLQK